MSLSPEEKERRRLSRIYKNLPENKKGLAQGLIAEAARLRSLLDSLWADIQQNGMTEQCSQSPDADPYERERPAARQYFTANKNYQTIIKQLDALVPMDTPGNKGSKLGRLLEEIEHG